VTAQPESEAGKLAELRKRFALMAVLDGICVVAGVGCLMMFLSAHAAWGVWGFAAALALGFGVQVWFVLSFRAQAKG
jgi:hypothetical protein